MQLVTCWTPLFAARSSETSVALTMSPNSSAIFHGNESGAITIRANIYTAIVTLDLELGLGKFAMFARPGRKSIR
jgi:hypothetical protein